jgi:hypothetical protein
VVAAYLTRWRLEEAIRFVKHSYDLEDIHVLTYQRLRNMAVLANAVAFFTAVVLGTRIKLAIGLFVRYQPVLTIEIEHAKHLNRLVFGAEAHIVDQVCERPNGDALPDRLLYKRAHAHMDGLKNVGDVLSDPCLRGQVEHACREKGAD